MKGSRLLASLKYRRRWAQIGVPFWRSSCDRLTHLTIGGSRVTLDFPDAERPVHEHELSLIYYDDCYRLRTISTPPKTILDIGANVGLFSMIARHHFPHATIHCYEPNPALQASLDCHLGSLGVHIHRSAVGKDAGYIELTDAQNSLHSRAVPAWSSERKGPTTFRMDAFRDVVERIGGRVDFLKLDCEGAEWEIFDDEGALDGVGRLAMEYHLWARPGKARADFETLVRERGFEILHIEQRPGTDFGLLHAVRR